MLAKLFKYYIYPIATLSGSIIGVGFLSLPYLATRVGTWQMLIYFVVLAAFITAIHVMFSKISLATPDFKRWPGFVGYYFGPTAKRLILIPIMGGTFGILLVYLIVGSTFLSALLVPIFGGTSLLYAVVYFLAAASLIFFGVKIISRFEFWALVLLAACLFLIFGEGFSYLQFSNLFISNFKFQISNFLLPYGAIMFSLWGTGLIPEVEEMMRGHKQNFTRVIVLGTLVPALLYLAFTILILAISGANTSESALIGLDAFLGPGVVSIALFIGVLTTFTAFITQGLLLKKIFTYDVGMGEFPAWALTCFIPFILYLFGVNSFIPLISFIGGVLLSIDGVLILLMYQKIGGRKWFTYPLMIFFVVIFMYSIFYFIW